ncbi:MAG: hypothetical protein ABI039_14000 [Vicinamibacterales bacterium]
MDTPSDHKQHEDKMDSVQLTRVMLNRQLATQQVHLVQSGTLRRFRLAGGATRQFLKTARAVQNLPSFAKRIRE